VSVRDSAHVMDDPFASLAALSATLAEHGQGLRAGQRVITGAFVTSEVGPGTWEGRFDGLGEVCVTFD
jgi:2-keto-4-pentenoate hydratase